jgi:flagellar biosynthesis anti-sigma factor FlgM
MKIENNHLNPVSSQNRTEGIQSNAREVPQSTSASAKDHAMLSDKARLLAKARSVAQESSDVRAERVQTVKQRVAEGTYNIPIPELAQQLMSIVRGQKA